uniref:Uncharacterized protein n=1 Tax=Sinocyclocheilus grahami TaxID=75366 RepID=A0A672P284_SINGR
MILFFTIYSLITFIHVFLIMLRHTDSKLRMFSLNLFVFVLIGIVLERCGIKHPKPSPFFGNLMMFRDVRYFIYFVMKHKTHSLTFSHIHTLYLWLIFHPTIKIKRTQENLDIYGSLKGDVSIKI